jgi:hypothetical protein
MSSLMILLSSSTFLSHASILLVVQRSYTPWHARMRCAHDVLDSRHTNSYTHPLTAQDICVLQNALERAKKKVAIARRPQLDQELLERVLQKDPLIDAHAKDGSIPKLAEAVAEVFGYKHDVSELEEPIQKKDTDPVSWRTS